MKIFIIGIILICFIPFINKAQDADSLLNSVMGETTTYTSATFKSTRIINGHSIERMKAKQLDVRIHHRFGELNGGSYNLWGLDQSNVFFGLEYGITDNIMVGIGRSTFQKTFNGFTKLSILRQSKGALKMPISMSVYIGTDVYTLKWEDPSRKNYFTSRLSYIYQVLIARKFNERLSLQLSPTMIHQNLVETALDNNDSYAIGIGGRFKITKRLFDCMDR